MGLHLRPPCMYPRILSASTLSGTTGGGQAVTFTGYHLKGSTAVWTGSVWTAFSVGSDAAVTATSPTQAAGSYGISIQNPRGDSTGWTSTDALTWVVSP